MGGGASPRPADAGREGQPVDDNRRPLDAGAPLPPAEREQAHRLDEQTRSTRRQELLRDYGREVPQEQERDAEIERDRRGRERTRER